MSDSPLAKQREKPNLGHEIQALSHLSYGELVIRWIKHNGRPPPKSASRHLLERAIAYSLQEHQHGGLSKSTLKVLLRHAHATGGSAGSRSRSESETANGKSNTDTLSGIRPGASALPILRPGTRVVREWQGKSHSVEVRDDGFQWNGKVFASLSAVATAITGTRWSGPRFFRP